MLGLLLTPTKPFYCKGSKLLSFHVDFLQKGWVNGAIDCVSHMQHRGHLLTCPYKGFPVSRCDCPDLLQDAESNKLFTMPRAGKLVKVYSSAIKPEVYTFIVNVGGKRTKIPYGRAETPEIDTTRLNINVEVGEWISLTPIRKIQYPVVSLMFEPEGEPEKEPVST